MVDQARALIIGASRGIGLELVRQYAADGWIVHATTRTADAAGGLAVSGDDVHRHELDVRSESQLARLVAELEGTPIDVLVHNAGVYTGRPRQEIMAVNTEAPLRVAEALEANVASSAQRKLALMSSGLGARRGGQHTMGAYAQSKAELNDGLRARADRWGAMGITAVVINPGWVRTDMGGSSAPLAVDESVAGIRRLLGALTPDMHGRFWSWDGAEHPW